MQSYLGAEVTEVRKEGFVWVNVDVLSEVLTKVVSDLSGIKEYLRFIGCKHGIGEEHWTGPNDKVRELQEMQCTAPGL